MNFAAILLLGFFLGMRHATDSDHVVAVSAIVSRERSLKAAAPIGVLWGLGHTLTILVVGGAIILFGIVIPPYLGLGMEMSVGIAMAMPIAAAARRFERLHRTLGALTGLTSIGFGAVLVYELGFVHGLFTGHPQWTPQ